LTNIDKYKGWLKSCGALTKAKQITLMSYCQVELGCFRQQSR